jgi:hypothetical protein
MRQPYLEILCSLRAGVIGLVDQENDLQNNVAGTPDLFVLFSRYIETISFLP